MKTRGLPKAHEGAIHAPKESLDVEHDYASRFLIARLTRRGWKSSIAKPVPEMLPPLLIILLVLGGGRNLFAGMGPLFIFSILVSTVSFAVYVALLRKQLGQQLT